MTNENNAIEKFSKDFKKMLLFFQHKMSLLIFLFSYLLISLVHYISIYILCLSVCFFDCLLVSNNCQNGWTDRAKFFLWDLVWPQGRVMDDWILKNVPLNKNLFWKVLKIHEISFMKSASFCFVLQCIQREDFHNWNSIWC